MDAFMPFIQRVPGTPAEQDPKQVVPVFREARLEPLKPNDQRFLILRQPPRRQKEDGEYPPAPYTTPEEEQHTDEDGHLDIFV